MKAQCYAENKQNSQMENLKNQNRLNKYLYPTREYLPVWETQSSRTETNVLSVQCFIISVIKKLETLHNDKMSGLSTLCIEEK